jgi:hypothetical protein
MFPFPITNEAFGVQRNFLKDWMPLFLGDRRKVVDETLTAMRLLIEVFIWQN